MDLIVLLVLLLSAVFCVRCWCHVMFPLLPSLTVAANIAFAFASTPSMQVLVDWLVLLLLVFLLLMSSLLTPSQAGAAFLAPRILLPHLILALF